MLKGRYRILEQIGQGGFSDVYKAEDTLFADRLVAIKGMSLDRLSQPEREQASEAFKQEALLLASLTHPHLAAIYDYFADNGSWYLVMSFIEGETLEAYLEKASGGRLPVAEVLQIALDLCSVLGYLHERQPPIIFRDLKPANVMRTPTGHLYLIDFGIARFFKPGQRRDTIALGSPGYAAPEQYGKTQTTPRADIYALGATMHQMLSGIDPSDAPFLFAALPSSVPSELNTLVMRMLNNDARLRPESMAAVKQELQQIAQIVSGRAPGLKARGSVQSHRGPIFTTSSEADSPSLPSKGRGERHQQQQVYYQPSSQPAQPRLSRRSMLLGAGGLVAAGGLTALLFRQIAGSTTVPVIARPKVQQTSAFPAMNRTLPFTPMTITFSPDGRHIVYSGANGLVYVGQSKVESHAYGLVHVGNGVGQVNAYNLHSAPVPALSWSPDGMYIASGSYDTTVKVWEANTGKVLLSYNDHTGPVLSVAWSPDGKTLVSSDAEHVVQVWHAATGKNVMAYTEHSDQVTSVAWAPSGGSVVSGSADRTVRVWEPLSGETIFTFTGHKQTVQDVAWAPNGKHVASASDDQTIRVWNVVEDHPSQIYTANSPVMAIDWSPDSRFIVSGSLYDALQKTNGLILWNVSNGTSIISADLTTKSGYSAKKGVLALAWSKKGSPIVVIDEAGNVETWTPDLTGIGF
jgi:serine/threonine protein kinase/Tol biopolymer transport system component